MAKNGILLLDADQRFRAEGSSAREAIIEAGERRRRPIIMTALATNRRHDFAVARDWCRLADVPAAGDHCYRWLLASMVLSLIVTPAVQYHINGLST